MVNQDNSGQPADWWAANSIAPVDTGQVTTGGNPAPPVTAGGPSTSFTNTSTVTPPAAPYAPGATTDQTAQGLMSSLLAQGLDPNTAIQQVNAQFGLQSGSSYAWRSIPGAPGGGVVEVPGGSYFAPGSNGQWGLNAGDSSGAAASTGTNNQFAALATGGLPALDATPPAYASNPNAPQYSSLATPTSLSTPFTLPTATDLTSMPGYQVGLDAGTQQIQRSAAAAGSVLNPGTVQQLNRYATDYAGTQYANLTGEALAARGQNNTEFQQAQSTNTGLQTNRYSQYLAQNAQALSDYMTNYNVNHTAATDYWSQLKDVSGAGLTAGTALPTG